MAIWQYMIFAIPEEELESYFKNVDFIPNVAFNNIEWWKYRTYKSVNFNSFKELTFQESWSKNIKQLGHIDSDCVEVFVQGEEITEIAIRIDLRKNYKPMVNYICEFGQDNHLCFLNNDFKLLFSLPEVIHQDINDYRLFDEFTKKLDK